MPSPTPAVGVEVLWEVLVVARDVALNHRPGVGCLVHKGALPAFVWVNCPN